MLLKSITLFLALSLAALASGPKKTLFVDKMGGFEQVVADVLRSTEVPVEVIEESAHPDLKVLLGKSFTSVYAEILYQKQTGRRDESILKAVDVKTGKEMVSYRFHMERDEASQRQAAKNFADLLRKQLVK